MVSKITSPITPIEEVDKINEIIDDKQDNLVSGTNIKTINGSSILGSGDMTVTGTVTVDNLSITNNSSSQIQTVGVINQNNTTTALKTWTGTRAQYDAITSKDVNTLYHITDDTDMAVTLLQTIYPVGSIYIGTMANCPLAGLFGTWTKVSEGRVLQGSGNNITAGTTIEAGLPNITGDLKSIIEGAAPNGCFYSENTGLSSDSVAAQAATGWTAKMDASRSNSIYGNSNTVQPPAYVVNIWQRTA